MEDRHHSPSSEVRGFILFLAAKYADWPGISRQEPEVQDRDIEEYAHGDPAVIECLKRELAVMKEEQAFGAACRQELGRQMARRYKEGTPNKG